MGKTIIVVPLCIWSLFNGAHTLGEKSIVGGRGKKAHTQQDDNDKPSLFCILFNILAIYLLVNNPFSGNKKEGERERGEEKTKAKGQQ